MKLETHQLSGFNTWTAYDADRYDGAPDAGPQIVGNGATEREAISDLLECVWNDRDLLADMENERTAELQKAVAELDEKTRAFSKDSRDAKRLRVLMQWGVRHSMEHPISDPTQPYYVCLNAGERGKCTAHGATLAIVADRAIEWLERHGNPEAPK